MATIDQTPSSDAQAEAAGAIELQPTPAQEAFARAGQILALSNPNLITDGLPAEIQAAHAKLHNEEHMLEAPERIASTRGRIERATWGYRDSYDVGFIAGLRLLSLPRDISRSLYAYPERRQYYIDRYVGTQARLVLLDAGLIKIGDPVSAREHTEGLANAYNWILRRGKLPERYQRPKR